MILGPHKYNPPDAVIQTQMRIDAKRYETSFEYKLRQVIKQEVGVDPYSNMKVRKGNLPLVRQLYMAMVRKYTDKSLAAIGSTFDTSHDYVIYSINVINNRTETNKNIKELFDRIETKVKNLK
jgi:hypothetical protein